MGLRDIIRGDWDQSKAGTLTKEQFKVWLRDFFGDLEHEQAKGGSAPPKAET